jgi:putative salt-induced outer membrane protein YdiY
VSIAQPAAAAGGSKTNRPSEFKKFLAEWKGEVQAGMNLGFSSTDRQLYTARFKATHTHKSLRNILDYNASYGRTEGVLSDNRADGSWKVEYDISKRFLLYNAAGAGHDEIRKIDLQYDVGPGIGYKWLVRTNFVLKTELGGNYQEQFFADETSKKRYSLRLAEDFWWQITEKIRWDEKLEFFPQVDDPSDYRVRVESNLSYLLRNNLTLNLTVIDLYETTAPGSVSHNDLQIRSSIGIKF